MASCEQCFGSALIIGTGTVPVHVDPNLGRIRIQVNGDPTNFTRIKHLYQCCGSGMFYPGSYMKSGMQTYFFLASYAFRSKVLVLFIFKNIRDPETIHRIPDPGGKPEV
jgi:hypothetical protein